MGSKSGAKIWARIRAYNLEPKSGPNMALNLGSKFGAQLGGPCWAHIFCWLQVASPKLGPLWAFVSLVPDASLVTLVSCVSLVSLVPLVPLVFLRSLASLEPGDRFLGTRGPIPGDQQDATAPPPAAQPGACSESTSADSEVC